MKTEYKYAALALAISLVAIAVFVTTTVMLDRQFVHSSPSIVVSDSHEATVLPGASLILTSGSGDDVDYWRINYDGNRTVTVKQLDTLFGTKYTATLCGVECAQMLVVSPVHHLTITELTGHRVSVDWPSDWDYR